MPLRIAMPFEQRPKRGRSAGMTLAAQMVESIGGWLAEVMPPGFEITRGSATSMALQTPDFSLSLDVAKIVQGDPARLEFEILAGMHYILSSVQDEIAKQLREPWPRVQGSFSFPLPEADIEVRTTERQARVRAGYKLQDRWILETGPISLEL